MSRIFISHSSQNETEAIEIKDWIETNGWDGEVFLDLDPERGLVAGEKWVNALKEAVHRCEAVLPLISKEWRSSKWCLSEVGTARLLGKQIIPIIIDNSDISSLPADMTSEQIVDRNRDPNWEIRLKDGLKRANLDPKTFHFKKGRRPYPGLEALTEDDAAIFFGRDAQIVRGLDRIRALKSCGIERLMIILGASGSGKSSFLRAGLLPRLARDDRNFLPIKVIRPELSVLSGDHGLYQALSKTAIGNLNRKSNMIANNLPINKGDIGQFILDNGLHGYLNGLCNASRIPLSNDKQSIPPIAVLSVDQAEELFGPSGSNETDLFIDILTNALSENQQLIVIFAIRSDAYPQVQADPRLTKLSQNEANLFNLAPMEQGSYRTIIEGPAKLVGPNLLKIEPLLIEALLEDSSGADALPLLAFTLERLYENYGRDGNLTLEEYKKMGRLEGAIEAAVEDSYNKARKNNIVKNVSEFKTAIKAAFIPHLADVNDVDQFVRRVAALEKLPSHTHDVISLLVDQHLVIKDRRGLDNREQDIIEVAHEALLREWQLLRGWLEEEKDNIRAIGAVSRSAVEWKKNGWKEEWLDHTGERLSEATKLSLRDDMQNRVGELEKKYLKAAIDKEKSIRREREEQQKREKVLKDQSERRKTWVLRISILASAVAIIITAWAFSSYFKAKDEAKRADEQAKIAKIEAERANEQKKIAVKAKKEAKHQTDLARRGAYNVQLARAGDRWQRDPSQALALLNDTTWAPLDLRDFTWGFLYRLSKRLRMTLTVHTSHTTTLAFSPDGYAIASGNLDGTITLWDLKNGLVRNTIIAHKSSLSSVIYSPDGKTIASGSYDGSVKLWDIKTGQVKAILTSHNVPVSSLAFSPDGKTLSSAGKDGTINLWDSKTGQVQITLTSPGTTLHSVAFSQDSKILASGSADGSIKIWDSKTRQERATMTGHSGPVSSLAFSPDSKSLASASSDKYDKNLIYRDKTIKLWDPQTGQERAILTGHNASVSSLAFSPDGKILASGSYDKTIKLWKAETNELTMIK